VLAQQRADADLQDGAAHEPGPERVEARVEQPRGALGVRHDDPEPLRAHVAATREEALVDPEEGNLEEDPPRAPRAVGDAP
jgi:hypothetical protein